MHLLLKFKNSSIKEFITDKTEVTIGRDPNNDIFIDNLAVSRFHAKIYEDKNGCTLEDLKSGNGTLLNNRNITRAALKDKDEIVVGKHSIIFVKEDKPTSSINEETYVLSPDTAEEVGMPGGFLEGTITVLDGGGSQTSRKLTKKTTIVGKSPEADIKLRGFLVAPVAFIIEATPSSFHISHTQGRRTARVNGQVVKSSQELQDGDIITAGSTKLLFHVKALAMK